jgi:hypothetical protein
MGISFLVAIVSCVAFANALSLEAPEHAVVDENLTVTIRESSEKTMDVKLFVEQNGTIISQIYQNGWKNAFYYIPAAFPEQKEFLIRIRMPASNAALCIRLRQTGVQKYEESCQVIAVDARPDSLHDTNSVVPLREELPDETHRNTIVLQNPEEMTPRIIETREGRVQRMLVVITIITTVLTLVMVAVLFFRQRIRE